MRQDGIEPDFIKKSLSLEANRNSVFQAGEGAGMSGSFFFFSKDNRFLIKTLRGDEREIALNMLDNFIEYCDNHKTLIAKIYGIYTIKVCRERKLRQMLFLLWMSQSWKILQGSEAKIA